LNHRGIGRGGGRGLFLLGVTHLDDDPELIFNFPALLFDEGGDIGQGVAGQHPAVEVKDIIARDGVDIGDIGFLFGGLESADRGFEQRVVIGEFLIEGVQADHQVGGGFEGIAARSRGAGMTLLAAGDEPDPAD